MQERVEHFVYPNSSDHEHIQVSAYFKAERRGFAPGHALDDWLEAEEEFMRQIWSHGFD
jgi:hypothetical protein